MEPVLVRGADFSSTRISIGWTVTAKRPDLRGLQAGDDPKLIEIRDDGVTLELPEDLGRTGDRVLFQLQALTPEGQRATFSAPAQIESVDPSEGQAQHRVAVKLKFLIAASTEWENFRKLFDARQAEIDDFLKAARGY